MSAPDERKKFPTQSELARIGTNDAGEDIYMNQADADKYGGLKGKAKADEVIRNKKLPPKKPMAPPPKAKPKKIGEK